MNSAGASRGEALLVTERLEDVLFADTVVSGHLGRRVARAESIEYHVRTDARLGDDRPAKGDPRVDRNNLRLLGRPFGPSRKREEANRRAARAAFDSIERTLEFATKCRLPATRDIDELSSMFQKEIQTVGPKVFGEQWAMRSHFVAHVSERRANTLQGDAMMAGNCREDMKLAEI